MSDLTEEHKLTAKEEYFKNKALREIESPIGQTKHIVDGINAILKELGQEAPFVAVVEWLITENIYPQTEDEIKLAALAYLIERSQRGAIRVPPLLDYTA
jgi:hypothetical protein